MNKIEMIVFSVVFVCFVMIAFDFITYVLKSAPKQAYFTKRSWKVGMVCFAILAYWFVNGYKFL